MGEDFITTSGVGEKDTEDSPSGKKSRRIEPQSAQDTAQILLEAAFLPEHLEDAAAYRGENPGGVASSPPVHAGDQAFGETMTDGDAKFGFCLFRHCRCYPLEATLKLAPATSDSRACDCR